MMGRKKKLTEAELARRLTAVKVMVAGMKDAMPSMAKELRREACETLDELIEELV